MVINMYLGEYKKEKGEAIKQHPFFMLKSLLSYS